MPFRLDLVRRGEQRTYTRWNSTVSQAPCQANSFQNGRRLCDRAKKRFETRIDVDGMSGADHFTPGS